MKKFWQIFWNEYKRQVFRKRFIFAILSMPFFVALIVGVGFLSVWMQFSQLPIGYVDPAGLLVDPQQVPIEKKQIIKAVQSLQFPDETSAKKAFEEGKIQAYFVLSENYLSTGEATMISGSKTGGNAQQDFGNFLIYNLIKDQPEPIATRLSEGTNLIIRSMDGSREMGANNWLSIVLPILAGVLFIIVVNISGNYLLQAVVEEKENRTIEILVTSVSPTQLMAGKIIGNLMVGLTQLITWLIFGLLTLKIAPMVFEIGDAPKMDLSSLLLMAGTLLPAFVMVAAAMGAVGATASESREAQQVAGWFTIPIAIPLWFSYAILNNPNGALSVAMSLFPLTAPVALPMRAVFTEIPAWQIIMEIILLCLLAAFTVWLSGRIFRLGMLRYGKKVRLREVFQKARS